MIVMKSTIELEIGLSFLLQSATSWLVTDRETDGHCQRRTEIPEAETPTGTSLVLRRDFTIRQCAVARRAVAP